ncbi:MAG: redoxin domain-containing protein [Pyrinomonadaceae bacterium]|nr:redoxin domain-containing protein [Pyrinomonadaceae bacterium]
MEILLLTLRLFLFGIFALAGIGKLYDLEGSKKAVESFGVPASLSKVFGVLLPIAEIAVAISFLFVQTSWFGAIGGAALLTVFLAGMLWQMWQGNAPDCHCFGQIHSEPVSKKSLLRNAAFIVPAIFLIISGTGNQGLDILSSSNNFSEANAMQIILGLAVIGFLAAIVFFLKKISEQQTQIMRRIEVLELLSHEGGKEVERDDVSDPAHGLPIGSLVPAFELPNMAGENTSHENILPSDNPTLLFFVSPSCNPCEALIPDFQKWQKDLGMRVNFAFVSSGKVKDNKEKFGQPGFENLYIQEENEISELFGAEWTPTAILVNADRTLASRPAAGDTAIKELVEQLADEKLGGGPIYLTNGHGGKVGEKAPEFALEDLEGNEISSEIFNKGKTLVTYWSTGCPHCVNMLEDLRDWDNSKEADDLNLLVISSGDAENHEDMGLKSPIVIDNEHEVGPGFGMSGTPSAVLVNEEGKIVSETAVGSHQIWSLLGKKK